MKSIRHVLLKISHHLSEHQINRASVQDASSSSSSNAVLTDIFHHCKRYTNVDFLRTHTDFDINFDFLNPQQTQPFMQQIALLCLSLVTVIISHSIFRRLSNRKKTPRSSCRYTNGDSYKGEILHGKKHGWGVVRAGLSANFTLCLGELTYFIAYTSFLTSR